MAELDRDEIRRMVADMNRIYLKDIDPELRLRVYIKKIGENEYSCRAVIVSSTPGDYAMIYDGMSLDELGTALLAVYPVLRLFWERNIRKEQKQA